ncbi:MAG: AMP-binding protein, partial [Bacteroidales bacterium]|nr:AMP-binding protein [Bacteroidales bacterium]
MTTIIDIFEKSVSTFFNNPFLWEKKMDKYKSLTYGEVFEQTKILAAGLISLKIKKEDRIALLSEGRNYWVISELAILYTGAINVPLSVKL